MSVTPRSLQGWIAFVTGWALSFALRLVPFRPPNIEIILAVQTPFAKRYGFAAAFSFAFLNIAVFDAVTGKLDLWTFITSFTYGLLAVFSVWYFKKRAGSPLNFAIHAVYATLLYDALTGLTIGPLFFGQSFIEATVGQLPFTAYHLLGNVAFGALLSPVLLRWIVANPRLEASNLRQLFSRPSSSI